MRSSERVSRRRVALPHPCLSCSKRRKRRGKEELVCDCLIGLFLIVVRGQLNCLIGLFLMVVGGQLNNPLHVTEVRAPMDMMVSQMTRRSPRPAVASGARASILPKGPSISGR